ncbi:MAG: 50S ribosomal protein L29 [Candidatus Marinimicrobia bacterium]|jgi:large subunit ribosomal protein L29|nr:50S ribosomal protein L29 [Candidatus Neomarinimicrobiota bacterium]MBT3948230.1 50S ribosomal protein L29 [Candidatus Neomarinimicrobiota bacterium]MBT4308516.1 50S ribosomal protein L29 [Candidatus Neomarinimicrobiota bacterium]MBT4736937.1 50S ribosomal protein L29 [Candidatus Neomarinimicrobiota bacterium]MBT5776728.1 50S ribosomal protein L29 [Candidatus Neomarinimicrobiota bacterium]|tara:strand:- start:12715 stop:12930 length:216 start_codon:yes stop_codon:yes gene_type:complete
MKKQELKDLSMADIDTKLHDNLEDLQNLRFQKALQQLENPIRISHLKKSIAQLKTVKNEFDLGLRGGKDKD